MTPTSRFITNPMFISYPAAIPYVERQATNDVSGIIQNTMSSILSPMFFFFGSVNYPPLKKWGLPGQCF